MARRPAVPPRPPPCTLCRKPTPLRSHAGEAVHKVCAERWNSRHPGAGRFVSDAQARRRKHDDDHV
ncbi:hypothetical protein OG521_39790 (plasmid) [Streptomyces sp. NBC_01463]